MMMFYWGQHEHIRAGCAGMGPQQVKCVSRVAHAVPWRAGLQRLRPPCLFIARVALFDRRANRFLGNVLGLRPDAVSHADKRWSFNPEDRAIVRCGCVQVSMHCAAFPLRRSMAVSHPAAPLSRHPSQADPQAGTRLASEDALSVYIELNVSYRLTVEDTVAMPTSETRVSPAECDFSSQAAQAASSTSCGARLTFLPLARRSAPSCWTRSPPAGRWSASPSVRPCSGRCP
jgi:hypothetical protein